MKNIKQKLRDLCWYKICYADLLKNKDKDKYANIMADEILKLFSQQKQEMVEKVDRILKKYEDRTEAGMVTEIREEIKDQLKQNLTK